jgi:hypothetical protein
MTARWVSQQLQAVREADLQATITDLCHLLGIDVFHVRNSRGMTPGWPDLAIIGTRVLYRELKSEAGSLSADQRRVGARLTAAGADWAVWRPRDLRSGLVARQLHELCPPPTLPFTTQTEGDPA